MRQDFFEYFPQFKLLLLGNHMQGQQGNHTGAISLTLANSEQAYRPCGMRNMGSLSTISRALSSISFMRPRFPKVAHRPLTFDQ